MQRTTLLVLATLCFTPLLPAQQNGSASAPSGDASQGPIQVSAADMLAQAIRTPHPNYPQDARDAHIEGTVTLHAIINKDGTVKTASVESGPDMLRSPAIDAAQQYLFRPYLKDGQPVEVDTTLKISFHMGEGSLGPARILRDESGPPPPQSPAIDALTNKPKGPARISGGVMAGQVLTKSAPGYPAEARAAHVSGTVVLHAIIGKDGIIKNLVVASGPELLQPAALDAVKTWTYRPYILNGEPTEVDTTIMVNFHLNTPPPPPASPNMPQ